MCFESKGTVENFGFKYLNEEKQLLEQIEALQAKILDTPYDIIIGRPTILKHNLLHKLKDHFSSDDTKTGGVSTRGKDLSAHDVRTTLSQPLLPEDHPALSVLFRKDDLITPEYDDDGIELKVKDYPWEREDTVPGSVPVKPQPHIEGSVELQERI
ncbi:MAG: hypothetical protein P4L69_00105, partial [Desulfosporosinus sp.]|nr:hypothetical protein [Desulfosporosinus sp.]